MKNHMRIQDNNTEKLYFKTHNELKYEMFHDMCAPSSRIIFKAEIRKLIIKTFKSE